MGNRNDTDGFISFDGSYDVDYDYAPESGCSQGGCASCQTGCAARNKDVNEHRTITLTMEDDSEVECAVLTAFLSDGNHYIALLPLDETGQNQSGEVYLYRFNQTEDGQPVLDNIETDEEYDKAAAVFNEVVEKAIQAEAAEQL